MFQNTSGTWNFNSVMCVEGKFEYNIILDPEPKIELKMVYANNTTRLTYGSCPVRTPLLSPKTKEMFLAFLQSAEEDYGKAACESGVIASWDSPSQGQGAETEGGIVKMPTTFPRGLGE